MVLTFILFFSPISHSKFESNPSSYSKYKDFSRSLGPVNVRIASHPYNCKHFSIFRINSIILRYRGCHGYCDVLLWSPISTEGLVCPDAESAAGLQPSAVSPLWEKSSGEKSSHTSLCNLPKRSLHPRLTDKECKVSDPLQQLRRTIMGHFSFRVTYGVSQGLCWDSTVPQPALPTKPVFSLPNLLKGSIKNPEWASPGGLVVKFGALCFGSLGLVPRHGPTALISGHAVAVAHIQNRGRPATDVSSGRISLCKKKKKNPEQEAKSLGRGEGHRLYRDLSVCYLAGFQNCYWSVMFSASFSCPFW